MIESELNWPLELALDHESTDFSWSHRGSNLCLDFHGDAIRSKLVVFSDGNHHMALHESIQKFLIQFPKVVDVFYATTPPSVLLDFLKHKKLLLGNLVLSVTPNIFISPGNIINRLKQQSAITKYEAFIKSRGNVFLVPKSNPKNIVSVADLFRTDVDIFLSNPETERSSYEIYKQTLTQAVAGQADLQHKLESLLTEGTKKIQYGTCIHHRELPQALANNEVDVALVYYHLALRYTRIFPELFEIVEFLPIDSSNNPVTEYQVSLLNDCGDFGENFYDFMLSSTVREIYQAHGLISL